jgi:hypothetical protein
LPSAPSLRDLDSWDLRSPISNPLPLTPGRRGAMPSLALAYNSGGGNHEPDDQRQTGRSIAFLLRAATTCPDRAGLARSQ